MTRSIKTFRNVRARLYRATVGTWYSGWVVHLSDQEARIRLHSNLDLDLPPFETFIGECYGDGMLVRFAGRVKARSGQDVLIGDMGSMAFEPSVATVRFLAENVTGTLRNASQESSFAVSDISPESLGGVSKAAFTPGTQLKMSLLTPVGSYSAQVGVANCQSERGEEGRYRIGLQIVQAARLDTAVWQRLLEERAAA